MKTTAEKIQYLVNKGYDTEWLNVLQQGHPARFTLDQVIYLEEQVGKEVKIKTTYANTTKLNEVFVTGVSTGIVAAGFFVQGTMIHSITPESVNAAMKTRTFTRDQSQWNYQDGRLTPAPNRKMSKGSN